MENGSNFCAILRQICVHEKLSRRSLAKKLNISGAAVTKITQCMLEKGVIVEGEEEYEPRNRSGRKSIALRINAKYRYVIGINIEADRTFIALCDLLAEPVYTTDIATKRKHPPEEFIEELYGFLLRLLEENRLTPEDIVGIGVTIIGKVDSKLGVSYDSLGIWDRPVYLRNIFKRYTDIPVVIANTNHAFAAAGLLFGNSRFCDNVLFVKWMPGVGAAATVDGDVFFGSNFRGADLGHTYGDYSDVHCRCGRVGCLETILSIYALRDVIRERFSKTETPGLYAMLEGDADNANIDNIAMWMDCEDPAVRNEIARRTDKFATAISNMAITFNSEKIVFYGQGFFASQRVYNSICRKILGMCEWISSEDLMLTNFADKYNYVGTVSIAIEQFFINNDLRKENN